jgi:hypothetical protein
MGSIRRVASITAVCSAAALGVGVSPAVAHHGDAGNGVEVVASGLDNPRGLDLAGGTLVVAESGRGGAGPCVTGPEGTPVCLGATGAVTAVDLWHGGQHRLLSGLPSLAGANGASATGPSDVSFGRKGLYLSIGFGAPGTPAARTALGPGAERLGQIKLLTPDGQLQLVADMVPFETDVNPDPGAIESNPNSLDAKGRGIVVADAGGNDILKIKHGAIEVLGLLPPVTEEWPADAPFPGGPPAGTPVPADGVPTSVVRAKDGTIYVGQLTGVPFVPGNASVWKIVPGHAPEVVAGGFSFITDLALGDDGSIYVTQFGTAPFLGQPGALIRLHPDGMREVLAPGRLTSPTGVVLGHHAAYVSNHGAEAGTGEVLRIPLGG